MKKKEKILYIGGFELPDKNAAAQRVIANSKAMSEMGYDVVLVGLTKDNNRKEYYFKNFRCHDLSYPSNFVKWIKYLFNIQEEIKIIEREKPTKIIFYNYSGFKLHFMMKLLKTRKYKIYADITEWYKPRGLSISAIVRRIDVYLRMIIYHPKMDGLIVISDFLENYYKVKCKNVINIPPLVDCKDEKWVSTTNDIKNRIILTYAGSPGSGNKDKLDIIIESVKKIKKKTNANVLLQIVGIKEEEFVKKFNFSQLNVRRDDYEFVSFIGRVKHKQAIEILKKSDYSIFFRENNLITQAGFPTKFVEAISAGTPVITNYSSNLKQYFISYPKIGFGIECLTEEEILETLQKSLSLTKEERENNKKHIKNLLIFDFRNYIDNFKSFLG